MESAGPCAIWRNGSTSIKKTLNPCCHLLVFILSSYLQLSAHLTCLQITRIRGLTTLLPALGASCLFYYVQPLKTVVVHIPIGSINLDFITEGNTYPHCVAITHSYSRKTQRRSQVSERSRLASFLLAATKCVIVGTWISLSSGLIPMYS